MGDLVNNRGGLWTTDNVRSLISKMGLEYEYSGSAFSNGALLFYYLSRGEPVITEREIGNDRHSHSVVAYSFDKNGVWLSDSADGKRRIIGFDKLLKNRWFTLRVIKKKN